MEYSSKNPNRGTRVLVNNVILSNKRKAEEELSNTAKKFAGTQKTWNVSDQQHVEGRLTDYNNDFRDSQMIIEDTSLNLKNGVFKAVLFKGKPVALNQEKWAKLLSLRNENIVTYHHFFIKDCTSR